MTFRAKPTCRATPPYQRVAHLERAFAADIGDRRFLPYLMLHEFEAMLFADPTVLLGVLNRKGKLSMPRGFASPEEINEGAQTHPSARIRRQFGDAYRKALHGPQAVARIGLAHIRAQCPHLNEWIKALEEL